MNRKNRNRNKIKRRLTRRTPLLPNRLSHHRLFPPRKPHGTTLPIIQHGENILGRPIAELEKPMQTNRHVGRVAAPQGEQEVEECVVFEAGEVDGGKGVDVGGPAETD